MAVTSSTKMKENDLRIYSTTWIEKAHQNQDNINSDREDVPTDLCIVNLPGCQELKNYVVEQ